MNAKYDRTGKVSKHLCKIKKNVQTVIRPWWNLIRWWSIAKRRGKNINHKIGGSHHSSVCSLLSIPVMKKLRLGTPIAYYFCTSVLSSITHSLQYNHYLLFIISLIHIIPWCLILFIAFLSLMDKKGICGRSPVSGCVPGSGCVRQGWGPSKQEAKIKRLSCYYYC